MHSSFLRTFFLCVLPVAFLGVVFFTPLATYASPSPSASSFTPDQRQEVAALLLSLEGLIEKLAKALASLLPATKAQVVATTTSGTTTIPDTTAPSVSAFGYYTELDGRLKAGVQFSEGMDSSTLTATNFYLIVSANGSIVAGTVIIASDHTEYFTTSAVATNTDYQLVVKGAVKDLAGNQMGQDYLSVKFQSAPGVSQPPPAPPPSTTSTTTSTTVIAPPPPPSATTTPQVGGATLTGSVTSAEGSPVAGAYVYVRSTDYSSYYSASSDIQGIYTISNIPYGTYQIEVYPPYGSIGLLNPPPSAPFSLTSGQTLTQNLVFLKATKTVKGKVLREDGRGVSNAGISAKNAETGQGAFVGTDASGNYLLLLSGGLWEVFVYSTISPADWTYNKPPQSVSFSLATTTEEKIVDFMVTSTDVIIKGRILRSDGTAPAEGSVSINFQGSTGYGFGASNDQYGFFKVLLSAGTYQVYLYSSDTAFTPPVLPAVSVASGEVKDLGTITLLKATKTIKGKVVRSDGRGIPNAYVSAWRKDVAASAPSTQTDSYGAYLLLVSGGFWEVSVYPPSVPVGTTPPDWAYNKPPEAVTFSGATTTEEKIIDFVVSSLDVRVTGKVIRPDGTAPAPDTVFIDFQGSDGFGFGAPVDATGMFSIGLSQGTYSVFIHLNDPLFTPPLIPSLTLVSGQTKDLGTITLVKATKTIKGKVSYSDGKVVDDAIVNAWSEESRRSAEARSDAKGNFTLLVSGGIWDVNVYSATKPSVWEYFKPSQRVNFDLATTTEEKILDFVVTRTDAGVKGKILRPDGTPPPRDGVHVNFYSSDGFWRGVSPEPDGSFVLSLGAGSYEVSVWSNDSSLLPPNPMRITVASGETKDLGTIALTRATKTIKGKVSYPDGKPVINAGVSSWRQEPQGSIYTKTDSKGGYTLFATGGFWEVGVWPEDAASADWTYFKPPESVSFSLATTTEEKILDFVVTPADAKVTGKVLRSDGTPPARDTVFVNLYTDTFGLGGGSVDGAGSFLIKAPSGTYEISIYSQDPLFRAPPLAPLTLAKGEVKDLGTITLLKATKAIKGRVTRSDGRAVTDAVVNAFRNDIDAWNEARVDSNGNYLMFVLGGSWEVAVRPTSPTPDWISLGSRSVAFTQDATPEEKVLDFAVQSTDASVKGKVLLPNGSSPPRDTIFVDFFGPEGFGFNTSLDATGSFVTSLVAGTYNISFYSKDRTLFAPELGPIVVAKGESKDLGTIRLLKKSDHITGRVQDNAGAGVGSIAIYANLVEGSVWADTKTDASGSFDLLVTPGTWEVAAWPDPSTNFYNPDPPKRVTVTPGATTSISFILLKADATVSGTVVDEASGTLVSDLYGWVSLQREGEEFSSLGSAIERGTFSIKVSAGTYMLFVYLPPDSGYTSLASQEVKVASGENATVKVRVAHNTSKITGALKDEIGKVVTGVEAEVFASSGSGSWQSTKIDMRTGLYGLNVSQGTWYLGYHLDPASGFIPAVEGEISLVVGVDETVTYDLSVRKADAVLEGQVSGSGGVPHVFVVLSKAGAGTEFAGEEEFRDLVVSSAETNEKGFYRMNAPQGSYIVRTFVPPGLHLISAPEQEVTLVSGKTITVDLRLRKAEHRIAGTVFAAELPLAEAFVWGWSASGGYQETESSGDGTYRLEVTADDIWHLAAAKEINGDFWRSNEVAVQVASTTATTTEIIQNISLSRESELPPPILHTGDAGSPAVLSVPNGLTLVLPANAATTSGKVSINVTPDTRVPTQGATKTVGVAYELVARDAEGKPITNFNTAVTITLPYDEEELAKLGIKEEELTLSFWDETIGAWRVIENAVVDSEKNVISGTVSHFTRFGITAPADITSPKAPTGVKAKEKALPKGEVKGKVKFGRALGRGSHGEDIKILQQILITEGLLAPGLTTGFFGQATEAAVKKFQERLGLEPVGAVGPKTRAELNKR